MPHGIFCLEGDWWDTPHKRTTVEPMLSLLRSTEGWELPYKHRDVATVEEFEHHLARWQRADHKRFPILYLAFHGEGGVLHIDQSKRHPDLRIDLAWLRERLHLQEQQRMLYLGACSTLDLHGNHINRFLEATGLHAVCGYEADVDWMESTVFDLLLLSHLGRIQTITQRRIWNAYEDVLRLAGPLAKKLRFRLEAHPKILRTR